MAKLRNLSSWLPNLLGPLDFQLNGSPITLRRALWKFAGGVTITDVPPVSEDDEGYTQFTFAGGTTVAIDGPMLSNAGTGTLNDVATLSGPDPAAMIRFSGAAPTVTGLASGAASRRIVLVARGGPLVLANQSASSTAVNRIITGTGANVTVAQDSAILLGYDTTTQRWNIVGTPPITVDGPPIANAGTGALNDVVSTASGLPTSTLRFSGAAPVVNGIASGTDGRRLVVTATGGPLVLAHENAGSVAGNRIATNTGLDFVVYNGASALLVYDGTSARWRVTEQLDGTPLVNSGTGALNDVATSSGGTNASGVRFTGAAPSVTGFASGANGRQIVVQATGGPLVLGNENAGSVAANRIASSSGADFVVANGASAALVYDSGASRWRILEQVDAPPLANAGTGALNDQATTTNGNNASGVRFTGAAPTVNGFAGGVAGRSITVVAFGGPLILAHENAGSVAANRIATSTSADVTIPQGAAAVLVYDGTSARWRIAGVGVVPSGGGFTAGGDLSGTSSSQTVIRVNGATWPAAGALVTGTVPRVTGVSAVAYGALDLGNANARTGILPIANGGTNTSSAPAATNGIVVYTGSAYGGATNVLAGSNFVSVGATPSTSGFFRVPYNAGAQDVLSMRDNANSANWNLIKTSGATAEFADANLTVTWRGYQHVVSAASGQSIDFAIGANYSLYLTGSAIKTAQPIGGDSRASIPFRFASASISTGGTSYTLSAAEYECPLIDLASGPAGTNCDLVLPNTTNSVYWGTNRTASSTMRVGRSGQSVFGVIGATGTRLKMARHNGTDYEVAT